ncbi:tRNA (N6-isopentenyl adenosine(37)-C2)-methylthiotransferase MiaB [Acetobacteraceae bacterium]|nr:tRNA (N6-isopentenyl adenosine(37)-C2)-methylthiotransferase MiaB [Acetobacteraceae bacterium]
MSSLSEKKSSSLLKLHVITWGCQMNVYDSTRMKRALHPLGYTDTDDIEEADMILLNTCHIREKATEKLFSKLGRLKQLKDRRALDGKSTLLAVAGCVAQAEGKHILERAPYVDIVMGPQAYHRLPESVAKISRAGGKSLNIDFPSESKFDHLPENLPQDKSEVTAFLTIQEGCDKFCTYCVVPYTRGLEQSRPVSQVIEEAKGLVENGVKEITLLGQNVNNYLGDFQNGTQADLAELLNELAQIPGLKRLRYATSHPKDFAPSLIQAHRDIEKVMPFLHLPVQSGSDRILQAMNRGHTAEEYREIIAQLRAAQPKMAFSSDFIVSFPGETEKDFQKTLELVEAVNFAGAFSFNYSPRPGTPAAEMAHSLPKLTPAQETEKAERLMILQKLLREQQDAFNASLLNTHQKVLVTGIGRKDGQLQGRSQYLQPVHFLGKKELIGQEVSVQIIHQGTNSLGATLISEDVA